MDTQIVNVLPVLRQLVPNLSQNPRYFSGEGQSFFVWLRKKDEGTWDAVSVEYEEAQKNGSHVKAALNWLSQITGVSHSVIEDARRRIPDGSWEERRIIGNLILLVVFSPTTTAVRVDTIP